MFLEFVLESDANNDQFEETKKFPYYGIGFTTGIKFQDSSNTMSLLAWYSLLHSGLSRLTRFENQGISRGTTTKSTASESYEQGAVNMSERQRASRGQAKCKCWDFSLKWVSAYSIVS